MNTNTAGFCLFYDDRRKVIFSLAYFDHKCKENQEKIVKNYARKKITRKYRFAGGKRNYGLLAKAASTKPLNRG